MLVEMHNFSIEEQQRQSSASHAGNFDSFRNDDWDYEQELESIMKKKSAKKEWNEL
jgi:hypothetical protein